MAWLFQVLSAEQSFAANGRQGLSFVLFSRDVENVLVAMPSISIDGFRHLASNNQHQDKDGTQLQPYHSRSATAASLGRERAMVPTECLRPPSARQARQHDPDAEKLFDQRRLPITRASLDWSDAPQWPITVNSQPFAPRRRNL